ncbi:LuxR C-terminal-related transcriptional regulator [Mycobacterium sp. ITM-2016-00316]|uniref:LuxR C-terminal-related transcriptional regulator n=1 Tax=Mycobacterium sp. ITM-2016-00316 TaxID=2099695 RepID=UPI00115A5E15|nr:LuxR C-terminal-related transcriptional regulator [Mycobacterium sp. ITM-2016-00316]WNG81165.1 LuxR C-terminal-related transcriptional regulator [Mycobacterium sp. ITM-2016-00316]
MDPNSLPKLADRERDILIAWLAGTSDSTAKKLQISAVTLRTHLIRIMRKYEAAGRPAKTRAELFQRAVEDGLIDGTIADDVAANDPDCPGPHRTSRNARLLRTAGHSMSRIE